MIVNHHVSGDVSHHPPAVGDSASARAGWALPRIPDHVVERSHLNARLSSFGTLAIVQAPAGFGKTTLAAVWARDTGGATGDIVWFDAKRSDANSFWSDMVTAFLESGIPMSDDESIPYQRISSALHKRESVLTIVIDGFDSVTESTDVEEELHDLLLRRRSLRVLVTLRRAHPFTSIRWSDVNPMFIGAADLAFNQDETTQLANLFGCPLTDEMATVITNATRGWPEPTRALIAQVHRGALTPHDVPAAAAQVAHDYLTNRVIPQFDGHEWLRFMLMTSIPGTITDQLAVFISGDSTAPERLRRLESEGVLAVTNTAAGPVYEWPAAARTALRDEFIRRDSADEREVHGKLATWYVERHDHADEALEHARLSQDPAVLVHVIEHMWPQLIAWHKEELRSAFSTLPVDRLTGHLCALAVRDLVLHRHSQADDLFLSMIGPGPGDNKEIARIARSDGALVALRTMEAIMLALRSRGRFHQAGLYADAIATIFAVGREHQTAQIVPVAPGVLLQSGITRLVADDLPRALHDLRVAYDRSGEVSTPYINRDAAGKIALIHALTGDVKSAESWLLRYDATAEPSGWLAGTIAQSVTVASAIIAIERLDRERALGQIASVLLPSGPAAHESLLNPYIVYARARHSLIWGDRHGALLSIQEERIHRADWIHEGATAHALLSAVEADLLMALGFGNRARDLLERAPQHPALFSARARFALLADGHEAALDATSNGVDEAASMTVRAELLVIRAIAQWEAGHGRAATESLGHALDVAQTAGSAYAFATGGKRLAALAEHDPVAMKILAAAQASGAGSVYPGRLAIVDLTERERLILDRIGLGMNMRQMADDLFVSYNTVKTQMRSLYQKLGARSREQALVRAHEHGLLGRARVNTAD